MNMPCCWHLWATAVDRRSAVLILTLGGGMTMLVGRDFFPAIDGGQIQLHVRAPAGTRIESTERIFRPSRTKFAK